MTASRGVRRILRSTRFKITAPAILAVALLVGIGSIVLIYSVRQQLTTQVDQSLANGATFVSKQLAAGAHLSPAGPRGEYGQLLTSSGRLIGSSANLNGQGPLVPITGIGADGRYVTLQSPEFGSLRVYEVPLHGTHGPILVQAHSISEIDAAINTLAVWLAILAPLLVVIVGVLVWFAVGRSMRPVQRMNLAAAEISARNLDERIDDPATGDEIESLAMTFNSLLDGLETALRQQRRLVADASHELRSPLASMRANVEVDIARSRHPSETQRALLRGIQRLQDVSDQILILDRAQRSNGTAHDVVDLDEIVLSEVSSVSPMSSVVLDASEVSGGQCIGREFDFARIVDNLTSNALRYAATTVSFRLTDDDATVTLEVADDGPGVPCEGREEIFEPFFRLDEGRSRHMGGSGLGLAIVAELVAQNGGEVCVRTDQELGGACFVVRLPSARV